MPHSRCREVGHAHPAGNCIRWPWPGSRRWAWGPPRRPECPGPPGRRPAHRPEPAAGRPDAGAAEPGARPRPPALQAGGPRLGTAVAHVRLVAAGWTTTGRLSISAHGRFALQGASGLLTPWLVQTLQAGGTPAQPPADPGPPRRGRRLNRGAAYTTSCPLLWASVRNVAVTNSVNGTVATVHIRIPYSRHRGHDGGSLAGSMATTGLSARGGISVHERS